jgi:DNA repair protein RecN (Recombination protein N)
MLHRLEISNFALIDNVNLNLAPGFTAITGETGAGKSILLKALNLLLGERADSSVLNKTAKKCILEAEFDLSKLQLQDFFDAADLDYDPTCIIRREFNQQGKSRAFINDTPVQISQLKELGNSLISIHTQHESLDLFTNAFQTDVIDYFSGIHEDVLDYQKRFKTYQKNLKLAEKLTLQEQETRKEKDYLAFLLSELEEANLPKIDIEELKFQSAQINHAAQLSESILYALSILENDSVGPIQGIKELVTTFEKIKGISPNFADLYSRLLSTKIELEDIKIEIEDANKSDQFTEEEAAIIQDKMEKLNALLFKHNVSTLEELLALEEDLSNQLKSINSVEDDLKKLTQENNKEEKALWTLARTISERRKASKEKLTKEVQEKLAKLAMPDAALQIEILDNDQLNTYGANHIQFLVRTNLGGQFSPLKKVASGGELSRIMFSILSILSQTKNLPTLIFDEIDTGVSGEVAAKIAQEFTEMGKHLQLISITHLAQVAGKANQHLHVAKHNESGKTVSGVNVLSQTERIDVLAQIISGEKITEAARNNAQQLMDLHE